MSERTAEANKQQQLQRRGRKRDVRKRPDGNAAGAKRRERDGVKGGGNQLYTYFPVKRDAGPVVLPQTHKVPLISQPAKSKDCCHGRGLTVIAPVERDVAATAIAGRSTTASCRQRLGHIWLRSMLGLEAVVDVFALWWERKE